MTPLLTSQDHNLAGLILLKSSSKCLLNGFERLESRGDQ